MKKLHLAGILVSCCACWLAATPSYAGPGYQFASGHKVRFWSDLPSQDNIVTWSGARDEEGYATGSGTLTFYHENWKRLTGSNIPVGKPIVVSHFSGTMVKGKFDGMVSMATPAGMVSHAKYLDGTPHGKWADGPVPETSAKKALAERSPAPAEEAPAEGPSHVDASASETSSNAAGVEIVKETKNDGSDSLRALTAPPSSLPKTDSRLSRAEAIRNADEEAITAGLNVGDYKSRKVTYSALQGLWTVSYQQAGTDSAGAGKHFAITVDDQTGKASLVPGN